MLSRFRDGLVYPEYILNFRKDSIFRVLFVLIVYASIMSLNIIVDTVAFDGIDIETSELIEEALTEESINCEITSSNLVCDEDTDVKLLQYYGLVDMYVVSDVSDIDDYESGANINIIITNDQMIVNSIVPFTFEIDELPVEFQNLDFKTLESNPDLFLEEFIAAIDSYMLENKAMWGTTLIILFILFNLLLTLFVSILTGFFIRNRYKVIPFKETFRFGAYVSGSTFLILGLMSMLGNTFLFIILIVIINSRQMRRLTFSIESVLKNNLPQK